MSSFIILAQSQTAANVIQRTLEQLYFPWTTDIERQNVLRIIISATLSKNKSELFTEITSEIEKFTGGPALELNNIYVLVDKIDCSLANILSDEGWDSLIAMLVVALPEVHWKFGEISLIKDIDETDGQRIHFMHSLQSLLHPNWNPLLDGSGLRNYFLLIAKKYSFGKYIPIRKELATAIDDDPASAALHAYTAYRFGYRAYSVSTNSLAVFLFGKTGICTQQANIAAYETNLKLTFEDINLSFQDVGSMGYSDFNERNQKLPGLNNENQLTRFWITTGERKANDNNSKLSENKEQFGEKEGRKFDKPLEGIFGLWAKCKFLKPVSQKSSGFIWPIESTNENEQSLGHSSPAPIKQIAQYLVQRSIRLIEEVKTLDEALRGAVLVVSALELLGDKEPTTISKAYELKQRFEVLAECVFGGVIYPFDLRPRFDEMQYELDIIENWTGKEKRKAVRLNIELIIINYFIKIFDDKNDLEKAEICRHQSRCLQRNLWWSQFEGKKLRSRIFPSIIKLIKWYIDLLLQSIANIIVAISLWIVGLFILYHLVGKGHMESFEFSINTFFGGSVEQTQNFGELLLGTFGVMSGFFHLGILISHLYSIAVRK